MPCGVPREASAFIGFPPLGSRRAAQSELDVAMDGRHRELEERLQALQAREQAPADRR